MNAHLATRRGRAVAAASAAAISLPLLAWASPASAAEGESIVLPASDHLVAHYLLDETAGTVAADSSGNGHDGTYMGGPQLGGDAGVRLDGSDDYVDLPDNLIAGLDSATVSMDVLIRPAQSGQYFIWGMGNSNASGVGNGYMFATGNSNYKSAIATGNWSTEQSVSRTGALQRGVWKTITYTIDDATNTATMYLDGVQVGQNTTTTTKPGDIGGGVTTSNHIGKSVYTVDPNLAGSVRNFALYDTALSATDVAALVPDAETRLARDAAALDLGATTAVTSNLTLPASGVNGAAIAWATSDASVVSATGAVTRPAEGENDATVTLTATLTSEGQTTTRTFTVTVLAMPNDTAIAQAALDAIVVNNADDLRGNVTLPATSEGLDVTWTSSNPTVVAQDGVVVRQDADTEVTLTAEVTRGAATLTRDIPVTVRAAIELDEFEGYAFSYFTGNSRAGEKIYFAASDGNDALNWDELNDGEPMFTSTLGTTGLRDPFIIRSPEGDTFYMIATDLSIGSGTSWDTSQRWGSTHIEVWESHDLVNWSEQRHVKVAPDNAGNVWAPEAYYDESIGAYIVFWASKLYADNDPNHEGSTYNRMMYAVTRDFITFEPAQVWQDDTRGYSRIDTTVLEEDGTYYRFTKDEGAAASGCTDIMQERSDSLRAPLGDWTFMTDCIGRDAGTRALEGPTIFKANPGDVHGEKYYLFVDEYGGRGFLPLETEDIANPDWAVSDAYDLPTSPRHGTVFPVTATELAALRELIVEPEVAEPVVADEAGQVLRYDFEAGEGTTLTDVTGNGYDAVINGGATLTDGTMAFDGTDDFVRLPNNIMAGLEDITIEATVKLSPSLTGNYFIYGLGNTTEGVGDGYLFTTGNSQYRTTIATGNWETEQNVGTGTTLPRDQWVHLTYTLEGDTATLYLDGVQVATGTVTIDPGEIGDGFTSANYLGESNYAQDGFFRGEYAEFAIYNRALSAEEVAESVAGEGADVSDLEAVLAAAEGVDRDAFTGLTLARLDALVSAAQELLSAPAGEQAAVDAAVASVQAGIDALAAIPSLRDIATNPFKAEIEWLAATGVTTGWATSTPGVADFRPLSNVNRDQMAAFLYRLAGEPAFEAPAEPTFLDVPTDYVFYKEIEWLATTGVTTGWTVDEGAVFRPRIAVNRDVMAAFLYRYADSPDFDAPAVSPFVDVKTDHVFYKEIAWLAQTGISQGWTVDGDKQFRTTTPVKRDVMAAFLSRYANQFGN